MFKIFCGSFLISRKNVLNIPIKHFNNSLRYQQKEIKNTTLLRASRSNKIGPFGWILLIVPASTLALGIWQIKRKKYKEDLILKLQSTTQLNPVTLPENLSELEQMEYRPIHVRGKYLHDKELFLGPRSLIISGDSSTKSQLMTTNSNNQGYLVVTPFQLQNRSEIILINRGWVPFKNRNPLTRKNAQVEDVIDVVGIVRLNENRSTFTPKNQDETNFWFYRDLNKMAQITGSVPVFLDAISDVDASDGPIPGQTRVTLRNEHLSYILTWFSLCGVTSLMWYKQFVSKLK